MDLRSMLVSSNSTESTTVRVSSDKAEWIRIIAFTCSRSLKHHHLVHRVSIAASEAAPELPPSIFQRLFAVAFDFWGSKRQEEAHGKGEV
ncbi:hypothetical protein ACFX13_046752 [Malus domestica]|uniref:Uncharacterized protein n=1 Tax=Malus domestica TaxID=3750 RepID=A0A498J3S0_MALDO|nr:hypothetical protein DVH24_032595 [Malus domestica]